MRFAICTSSWVMVEGNDGHQNGIDKDNNMISMYRKVCHEVQPFLNVAPNCAWNTSPCLPGPSYRIPYD